MSTWREQRDASARAKGYADYSEYRALGSGRLAPGSERPSGELARQFQGHRGAADLIRATQAGYLVSLADHIKDAAEKDAKGRYRQVQITLTDDKGRERIYTVKRQTKDQLRQLTRKLDQRGADFDPAPSRDIRRM